MKEKPNRQRIIDDIQALRDEHVGTSWIKFSEIIYSACHPRDRKKNGEPSAYWLKIANTYLAELKAAQAFAGKA